MAGLPPEHLEELLRKIEKIRDLLEELEDSLLEPAQQAGAEVEMTAEIEAFIQTKVPADEVQRLSEVVPQLAEVTENGGTPAERQKGPEKAQSKRRTRKRL